MTRQHAEIKNGRSTYIFCGIISFCNFHYKNCVPFEIISQNLAQMLSLTSHFADIFSWNILFLNFRQRNRVRSITLILFQIISLKLGTNKSMSRLWLWAVTPSRCFALLCPFVILYMVSMEIVFFCRSIPLRNFQYRNHVHFLTLILFQIISQNLVQI